MKARVLVDCASCPHELCTDVITSCEALPVNPLIDDRDVEVILDELLDLTALHGLPYFADHDRETYQLVLESARALARDALFPAYRTLDAAPPTLADGKVTVHPALHGLFDRLVELGFAAAPRPHEVGGAQLPLVVCSLATIVCERSASVASDFTSAFCSRSARSRRRCTLGYASAVLLCSNSPLFQNNAEQTMNAT